VNPELVFVLLFCAATAVALVTRRFRIPYTVGLVVAGTLLGMTQWVTPPPLTKDLLFSVFLPGLVFEAAFHLEMKSFWRNRLLIAGLALPASSPLCSSSRSRWHGCRASGKSGSAARCCSRR
jgi:CPA1 family monovalent cation:H+ antiporter